MSHWAEIDENNIVLRVLVGNNSEPDEGEAFMNLLGGTWVKTSYNGLTLCVRFYILVLVSSNFSTINSNFVYLR